MEIHFMNHVSCNAAVNNKVNEQVYKINDLDLNIFYCLDEDIDKCV
jgi:hypothetical protein